MPCCSIPLPPPSFFAAQIMHCRIYFLWLEVEGWIEWTGEERRDQSRGVRSLHATWSTWGKGGRLLLLHFSWVRWNSRVGDFSQVFSLCVLTFQRRVWEMECGGWTREACVGGIYFLMWLDCSSLGDCHHLGWLDNPVDLLTGMAAPGWCIKPVAFGDLFFFHIWLWTLNISPEQKESCRLNGQWARYVPVTRTGPSCIRKMRGAIWARKAEGADGGQCHGAQGQPIFLVTSFPSAISAGVGCREISHSIAPAVPGHTYAGNMFLNIYSHVLLIYSGQVSSAWRAGKCCWDVQFLWRCPRNF